MVDIKFSESILRGEVELLGVEEIVSKLGVSRNTFERWVRNGRIAGSSMTNNFQDIHANLTEGNIIFPQPDIYIGKSPRWDLKTVAKWLSSNASK